MSHEISEALAAIHEDVHGLKRQIARSRIVGVVTQEDVDMMLDSLRKLQRVAKQVRAVNDRIPNS